MLVALTSAIAVGVAVWIGREKKRVDQIALGMVLGGALGNILDRVRHGYVVDFADLHFGEFRPFLIFNVGDAAISIGVVILLLRAFLTRKEEGAQGDYRTCVKPLPPLLLVAAVAASGCATSARHETPDEFAVARNAPLIVPPDFNLAPPVAGTAGLSAGDAQQQAIDALFGGPAPRSAARDEHARRGRPRRAQIGIRSTAGDPDTRIVDKGPATRDDPRRAAGGQQHRLGPGRSNSERAGRSRSMAEETLSARLVEIESMLDRSRRRFEEGTRLVEEAHKILGEIQQALIGSPRSSRPRTARKPRRGCSRR